MMPKGIPNAGHRAGKRREPSKFALPVVRQLFDIIDETGKPYAELMNERRPFIDALFRWRAGKRMPRLDLFVDAAGRVGYDVVLVRREETGGPKE